MEMEMDPIDKVPLKISELQSPDLTDYNWQRFSSPPAQM